MAAEEPIHYADASISHCASCGTKVPSEVVERLCRKPSLGWSRDPLMKPGSGYRVWEDHQLDDALARGYVICGEG